MAFNAENYIYVIVRQIAANFQTLDEAVKACDDLKNVLESYQTLIEKDGRAFYELPFAHDEVKERQDKVGEKVCDGYRTIEPLSVGFFGEWGSGKTHLLRVLRERVVQMQKYPTFESANIFPKTTIPVFFNAWRFEKEEHLIIPLFQTMLAEMENYELSLEEERKKSLRQGITKFKVLLKAMYQGLKIPDNIAQTVTRVMAKDASVALEFVDVEKVKQAYGDGEKDALDHEAKLDELISSSRLESIYLQIPQWIEQITLMDGISFVFLIDDLDRCLPENTLKMLESIKLFLDVPSRAFALAIDDDVVERGVAYHYRDYLRPVHLELKHMVEPMSRELPITGHEYLEKMIQLPFRIPVIDSENVRRFLRENYGERVFRPLDKSDALPSGQIGERQRVSDELLDFFAKTIPPKPRKIKRTALLFETKIKIIQSLGLPLNHMLLAKITLLELFAPRLLRFILNNGYRRIYDRLVHFKEVTSDKKKQREGSLSDRVALGAHINDKESGYTPKEQALFQNLMGIIHEGSSSRMVFDLDLIFDKVEKPEDLKVNIELKELKKSENWVKTEVTVVSDTFMEKLFRPDDRASWRDAFEDNTFFAEGEGLLGIKILEAIKAKAKDKQGFCDDPIWLGVVAEYITQNQFIQMLEDIYPFSMEPYMVTFDEYDRYCKATGIEKPDDRGWGRGRRPVINVSWNDATAYAAWLSKEKGVTYRLPTEDEWYLACNVGQQTKWSFGDDEAELSNYAWYNENSNSQIHLVGEKEPNALGLYDMHGNVWEWCEDWYDEKKEYKVVRGGSWDYYAIRTSSAYRSRYEPSDRNIDTGFRLLRTLPS